MTSQIFSEAAMKSGGQFVSLATGMSPVRADHLGRSAGQGKVAA
jgi:hypothetical protein